ncbi:hypothetical protein LVD15_01855 [Fulvivirga maritima]|uniref:hypothetical protein n=1 Tax=Fulvivirga maritima TaxID=2904247 RepID=UPI001F31D54C|nr:hypothetical protein [Fulvivirga maritima]UII27194.1 hypothetical protein LVD15_01855 [Fulvivirga maritima]
MKFKVVFVLIFIYFKSFSMSDISSDDFSNITQRQITNSIVFGKLYGFIRYFHPSPQSHDLNWNKFLEAGLSEVQDIPNDSLLVIALKNIFKSTSPSLKIYFNNYSPPQSSELQADSVKVLFWRHNGLGFHRKGLPLLTRLMTRSNKSEICSKLITKNEYDLNYSFIELNEHIQCMFNSYVISDLSLIKEDIAKTYNNFNASSDIQNIATVISVWNILVHFYPYQERIENNWDEVLYNALYKLSKHQESTENILSEIIANLNDSHAFINSSKSISISFNPRIEPVGLDYIENQLIVKSIDSSVVENIHRGDVIASINHVPVNTWISKLASVTSSTTEFSKNDKVASKLLSYIKEQSSEESAILEIIDPQNNHKLVKLDLTLSVPLKKTDKIIKYGNYYYVDLHQLKWKEFKHSLEKLESSQGIIFDLRKYPAYMTDAKILPHLMGVLAHLCLLPSQGLAPGREFFIFWFDWFLVPVPIFPQI